MADLGTHPAATFVLVHGASSGRWFWSKVRPFIREAGSEVFTPSLTGLGERAHLLSLDIGLDTHIQDVVNLLLFEDIHDAVLVGWSYSGMVITGVADRVPERIRHLVYEDAFVPHDGENVLEIGGEGARTYIEQDVSTRGDGWRNPKPESPDANPQLVDHTFKTYTVRLVPTGAGSYLPTTYIWCTNPPHPSFDRSVERAHTDSGWRIRKLPTWHIPMQTMPRELTDLLLEAAAPVKAKHD